MNILIKNVILNHSKTDIFIKNNKIHKIEPNISKNCEQVIDATDMLALPAFYNTHTHAAMTLMRGYSDDLPVMQWLEEKIWPLESHLTEEDVYIGTKLACLEMIKTGTVFANDMYWHFDGMAKAMEEMGVRAAVNDLIIDINNSENISKIKNITHQRFKNSQKFSDRLQYVIGPHAIYTVSKETLIWCADFALTNNVKLHIHLSETQYEVDNCIKNHGVRPIEYLEKIGVLGPNVIAAHSIWLDDNEIEILKKNKVIISHIPTSNMKLSSGIFPFKKFAGYEDFITLGTDGCASNNNLDMGEEMKFASCKAKLDSMNPTSMNAKQTFQIASQNGAKAFGINAGIIEVGKLADLLLVDLNNTFMTPAHNHISNFVYSANSSVINTTICDGKILMRNGKVKGEEKIISDAKKCAENLVNRSKNK